MKLLDNILAKFGTDKILHHVLGSLICALISIACILQDGTNKCDAFIYTTIGSILVLVVSIIKELYLDDKSDWKDVVWAMAGCLWVYASVSLGFLFN